MSLYSNGLVLSGIINILWYNVWFDPRNNQGRGGIDMTVAGTVLIYT